jgi:ectoine hydroxylase-related dioxygenase (phytanoyl-CoA dioxygenase family)
LDEATIENGALQVHPGSHTVGVVPGKDSEERFERLEIDPATYPIDEMISVPMKPGDVVFFGPFLVHTSPANPSDKDRRALLYTYQRAGNVTSLENLRKTLARQR